MRRFLKVLLISACVLLAGACLLLGSGVAYLSTYDNADWERLASRLVRASTGHELKVDGEFSLVLSWHPSLTLTRFSVVSGAAGSPFEVPSATRLEITLDLPRLRQKVIHVERLRLDGATIEWNAQEDGGARAGRGPPRLPWAVLLSDASVTSCRGVYRRREGAAPTTVDLDSLTLTATEHTGLRALSGRGTIDGYAATVAGRIGTIEEFLEPTGPFPVDIEAKLRGGTVAVKGTVARPAAGAGLALDITAEAPEVADLIRLVRRDWPETGALSVRARLAGDLPGARLEDVAAEIIGRDGSRLRSTGQIEDVSRWAGVALEFEADVPDASRFAALSGKVHPAFGRVTMKGRLTGSGGDLGLEDLSVSAKGDGFEAEAKGKAGRLRAGRGFPPADLDLSVSARGADLSAWSGLVGRELPALGPISFRARVTDHDGALGFADADLTIGASANAQVRVRGTVERFVWQTRPAVSGVSVRIEGSADPMSRLFAGRPPDIPFLDQAAEVAAELSDADGSLGLENVRLQVGKDEFGTLSATGSVDDLEHLRGAVVTVQIRAPSLAALTPLLKAGGLPGRDLPPVGPVNGTAELRDRAGAFAAEKIELRIGAGEGTLLHAAGKVGDLVAGTGADLTLDLSAPSLRSLRPFVGRDLPDIGPVAASGRLVGGLQAMSVEGATVALGAPGTQHVQAAGGVRDARTLEGLDLAVRVHLSDLALVEALVGRRLPEAGPVVGTVKVTGEGGMVSAREVDLRVGAPKTLWLDVKGQVGDVLRFRQVGLGLEGGAARLPLLRPLVGRELPDLGPVHATARLADGHGTLGLDEVRIVTGSPDRFQLEATGQFADLRALEQLDCDLRLTAKDLSALAALLERPLPSGSPVQVSAHFTGSHEKGRLSGLDVNLGRTKIRGEASYEVRRGKPNIVARLNSPMMDATDVYLQRFSPAEGPGATPGAGAGGRDGTREGLSSREWLFSDEPLPLAWLHELNLDVRLAVDELRVGLVRVGATQSTLKLEDGELKLEIVESPAGGGRMEAVLEIDGRGDVPLFAATATARRWDSGALLAQVMNRRYVEGQADGTLDLKARGTSLREMVASLDGKIVTVMAGGTLRGVAIDLLTAPVYRQLLGGEDPGEVLLNCAVEDVEIENGVATERTLLIDTKVSTVTGVGTIDLRTEQIDLMLRPEPKELRLATIKTPVSIRGDLANPTVTVESKESFFKKLAAAVGLGVLNPFAAVIPFMSTGSLDHHPCSKFLKPDAGSAPEAPRTEGPGLEGAPGPPPVSPGPQTGKPDTP